MLVEFKGQEEIINLDQVSFIKKGQNEDQFFIYFFAVIGRNNPESVSRGMPGRDASLKQFAMWVFDTEHERDSALQKIIFQSNGVRLGFESRDSYEV